MSKIQVQNPRCPKSQVSQTPRHEAGVSLYLVSRSLLPCQPLSGPPVGDEVALRGDAAALGQGGSVQLLFFLVHTTFEYQPNQTLSRSNRSFVYFRKLSWNSAKRRVPQAMSLQQRLDAVHQRNMAFEEASVFFFFFSIYFFSVFSSSFSPRCLFLFSR